MSKAPFIAIGNDELGEELGETVDCWVCGARHPVEQSEPPVLSFFRCGDKLYLCGIKGKEWRPR